MSIIIGISGGSGAGKTWLLNKLQEKFDPSELCALSMDHYYRAKEDQPVDENGMINFDLPSCIDDQRLLNDLKKLMRGESISIREYTFNNPNKPAEELTFNPAKYILLEGIFSLHFPEINVLLSLKIFIDCEENLRLSQRIQRDSTERAYDKEEIEYQWKHHVLPAHAEFLEPQKAHADLVIHGHDPEGPEKVYQAILNYG